VKRIAFFTLPLDTSLAAWTVSKMDKDNLRMSAVATIDHEAEERLARRSSSSTPRRAFRSPFQADPAQSIDPSIPLPWQIDKFTDGLLSCYLLSNENTPLAAK
jgi:hypothetical protein